MNSKEASFPAGAIGHLYVPILTERETGEKGERGKGVKFLSRQEGWDPEPEGRDRPLLGRGTLLYGMCRRKMSEGKDCLGHGKRT